ncbi:MAG: hypothetical protein KDE28_05130, partial [Anaerolineales bacterium]|nr:hypothetical protein [Anaerolineales bacterium]
MKRTHLLLGIIFLMSLLFGCQDDGASGSTGGDDESVTSPEATSGVAESDDEIGTAENEADEVPGAPRATATAIPFTRGAEETAAFPSDVAGKQADDIGNLTVALTTPTNATP